MYGNFETLHNKYLEPPEGKVWCRDWKGQETYEGDEYFDIMGELVPVDEIEEFIAERFERKTAGE